MYLIIDNLVSFDAPQFNYLLFVNNNNLMAKIICAYACTSNIILILKYFLKVIDYFWKVITLGTIVYTNNIYNHIQQNNVHSSL